MTSTGGSGVVTVATQPECAWNAASEASWISGITPTSGQGNGEVHFQVSTNPIATARQGDVVLNDVHVHVTQPGAVCQIAISPANLDVPTGGGTGSIAVTSATGCGWAASSGAPWITVTSGANGSGNAAVGFSVAANAGATRSGTIAIGEQVFVVTQPGVGVPPCQYRHFAGESGRRGDRRKRDDRGHVGGRLRLDGVERRVMADRDVGRERQRQWYGRILRRCKHRSGPQRHNHDRRTGIHGHAIGERARVSVHDSADQHVERIRRRHGARDRSNNRCLCLDLDEQCGLAHIQRHKRGHG